MGAGLGVMTQSRGVRGHPIFPPDGVIVYAKDIVYRIPVPFLDELKLRIAHAFERVTPQMLENTWRKTEYYLDILRDKNGASVEVV
jgi:hypothetical protein